MQAPMKDYFDAVESMVATHTNAQRRVSDAEFQQRMGICRQCPMLVRRWFHSETCDECGCFIQQKARDNTQKCPLGKW